jgi:hypothetical protein
VKHFELKGETQEIVRRNKIGRGEKVTKTRKKKERKGTQK